MTQIDRPQNIRLGIVLMMMGLALFTGGEAVVKTLAPKYDVTQIVWSRYVFHALVTFVLFSRSGIFKLAKTTRPWLHISRSALNADGDEPVLSCAGLSAIGGRGGDSFYRPDPDYRLFHSDSKRTGRLAALGGDLCWVHRGPYHYPAWRRRNALGSFATAWLSGLLRHLSNPDADRFENGQHANQPVLDVGVWCRGDVFVCAVRLDYADTSRMASDGGSRRHVWRWPLFADPWPRDGASVAAITVSLYPDHMGDTVWRDLLWTIP